MRYSVTLRLHPCRRLVSLCAYCHQYCVRSFVTIRTCSCVLSRFMFASVTAYNCIIWTTFVILSRDVECVIANVKPLHVLVLGSFIQPTDCHCVEITIVCRELDAIFDFAM